MHPTVTMSQASSSSGFVEAACNHVLVVLIQLSRASRSCSLFKSSTFCIILVLYRMRCVRGLLASG